MHMNTISNWIITVINTSRFITKIEFLKYDQDKQKQ